MQGKIETEFGKILIDTDVIATYAVLWQWSVSALWEWPLST